MKRRYIVLGGQIEAVSGPHTVAQKARRIITDTNREFASSIFVKLAVIPKATYYKNAAEVAFYERFVNSVVHWAHPDYRYSTRTGDRRGIRS